MRVQIILFEGTCGAGKTTLLQRVATALRDLGHNVTEWSQKRTYGPIAPAEDLGTLDDEASRSNLLTLVEELAAAEDGYLLVDTFHITQRVRPGVSSDRSFHVIDRALHRLNVRILHIVARPEHLLERLVVGRAGGDFLRYARKFGDTDSEIGAYFQQEQGQISDWVACSAVASDCVRSDGTIAATIRRIVQLLDDTTRRP